MNRVKKEILKGLEQVKSNKLDITDCYRDWIRLGFALIELFGIEARELFHEFSKYHPEYDFKSCERQFNALERNFNSSSSNRKFVFWLFREHGIIINEL